MRIHAFARLAAAVAVGTALATVSPAMAEMVTMKATLDANSGGAAQ